MSASIFLAGKEVWVTNLAPDAGGDCGYPAASEGVARWFEFHFRARMEDMGKQWVAQHDPRALPCQGGPGCLKPTVLVKATPQKK